MNLMNTYKPFPEKMVKGEGNYLIDENGKIYLDFLSGIAVNALGYGYKPLVEAMIDQVEQLIHCSNYFQTEPQLKLAELLVENTCFDKVFFSNSGAEANEGAIKLARKYSEGKYGKEKNKIITFKESFHGRTLATVSATGQDSFHTNFSPLPTGFEYAILNDIESVKALVNEDVCAILVEPIQGEGGLNSCTVGFMKDLNQLCKEQNLLLIFDEIQTGLGRTGSLFAYEWLGVEPDILTSAKALGGGLPLGAILAKAEVAETFVPGDHGSTFGGNPVACRGGIVVLETLLSDGFMDTIKKRSVYLSSGLFALQQKHESILELKGRGLMVGFSLVDDGSDLVAKAYEKGIIINQAKGNTMRFLPPLTIEEEEIDKLIFLLDDLLEERGN
ncbi:acetylornithine aminotransferase [endosymbiont 'TC1' of Trimyema compressum]|uniref:aspartate aminotransferase family protein n=1 Tax=endosymbiont 'TC1' of Trimyema compressum TaxID=243899 RepID=UPI0007F0D4F9|nr:aspartate aminotransferase family protein [endosymbiont 'TC1' of Trimyema compressum]AMP21192.1 acetylornithine aminotransferase [endosymbiont 'TC1' of Trimyema compressum]